MHVFMPPQSDGVIEEGTTERASVVTTALMNLLVLLESSALTKSAVTDAALKGCFSCVRHHVASQIGAITANPFQALWATMLTRGVEVAFNLATLRRRALAVRVGGRGSARGTGGRGMRRI